jgi:hypothetical protein
MSKPHRRKGTCAYCGRTGPVTRDHVVPRAIFARPYPRHPVIVPACAVCNNEKSKDDDYLRDLLALDFVGSRSPTAYQLLSSKVRPSFRRNSSHVLREASLNARFLHLHSPGGIYLGTYIQADLDPDHVDRALARLVRGLYYDAAQRVLPRGYGAQFSRYQPWDMGTVIDRFMGLGTPATRKIGDVFSCAFYRSEVDPFLTFWLLLFYGRVLFLASTHKGDEPGPRELQQAQ